MYGRVAGDEFLEDRRHDVDAEGGRNRHPQAARDSPVGADGVHRGGENGLGLPYLGGEL